MEKALKVSSQPQPFPSLFLAGYVCMVQGGIILRQTEKYTWDSYLCPRKSFLVQESHLHMTAQCRTV